MLGSILDMIHFLTNRSIPFQEFIFDYLIYKIVWEMSSTGISKPIFWFSVNTSSAILIYLYVYFSFNSFV